VDPIFPLHLWEILLPQAEITLNLLRTSRLHPQLSAAAHFHGLVDYNKTYFSPPGCKIIAHKKPEKRRTWAPHVQHGYCLGREMHNYRCQNVYISATASERIIDILEFFPENFPMPQLSSTYRLIMADNDMSNALRNPHPEVPFLHIGKLPTWPSPWENTIGPSSTKPMQSFTQSLENKWNTWPL
jgi:hypothetical protein